MERPPVNERETVMERPPANDCCPICFGDFICPCLSNCGHWFCGSCILEFWHYGAALKPCKCPICSRLINKLTPEASLHHRHELEVTQLLQNVHKYNRLFIGGTRGLILRVCESPLFIRRMFRDMMDPDRCDFYFYRVRLFAMLLGFLYEVSPLDFIQTGRLGVQRLFDYAAIALVVILHLVGIYRRRRLTQRVRHLAASHH